MAWGIAFTEWEPDEEKKELPCPVNFALGNECESWPGNQPSKTQYLRQDLGYHEVLVLGGEIKPQESQ